MINKKNILINCSNLHNGGGVAVATSFISQIPEIYSDDLNISLLISNSVYKNIKSLKINLEIFSNIYIHDAVGFQFKRIQLQDNYDLIFSVFGPTYLSINHKYHIMGFANPYLLNQSKSVISKFNIFNFLFHIIKSIIQLFFFRRCIALIVELPSIKKELTNKLFLNLLPIYVVSSAVDDIYFKHKKWGFIENHHLFNVGTLNLGVIAKNYPHKNLDIFPHVKFFLIKKYNIQSNFYVTLTDDEWSSKSIFFRKNVVNIGPLRLDQCPTFYSKLDGVVFPTLLECFSAVPLETMLMKKPLFSSNYEFIRDICSSHSIYFDPLCPESIADAIAGYYSLDAISQKTFITNAYNHALSFPDARSRANSYLNIIREFIQRNLIY